MSLTSSEMKTLRELGERYMAYATLPVHPEKVLLWRALNRGRMQRPMVCIDQLPWNELNGEGELTCEVADPFWRSVEWDLRTKIYKWVHFPVDMVLEPFITVPRICSSGLYGLAVRSDYIELAPGTTAAARHYIDVLDTDEDIGKILDIQYDTDDAADELHMQEARAIFGDAAPVVKGHGVQIHLGVWDFLTQYMGIENAYYNIVDRPDFVHACMERITEATLAGIRQAEEQGLFDDISNLCHCSHVYTDEMLPGFGEGRGPVPRNGWGYGMAQLFSSVSPAVTEEFELPYITRMAEHFGMIYYGCCDRLDDRLEIVKKIPNLRKVSCSPWSDRKRFAENIGDRLVMSNKPTPALLARDTVDWDEVRKDLRYTVGLARSNQVNLELILKDISTVRSDPGRLTRWAQIAMETVQEI